MNNNLENIKKAIQHSDKYNESEKESLFNSLKLLEKEITILEFKLERTENIKRTTSVLLEETIAELEQKRKVVEETNSALKKSMEELKAAQAQLIQSEKMASLGELTAGIAHEIQNPMNFVNNFSELNKELIDELKEELALGNTQLANEIINDIQTNEEKINHHGKRAEAIVKGMLLHSRGSSGQKEPTDINALCDEYLRLSYHGFRAKDKAFHAGFKLETDKKLPKIEVVPQDIGRELLNLINNAFYVVNEKAKQSIDGYKPEVMVKTSSSPFGEGGIKGGVKWRSHHNRLRQRPRHPRQNKGQNFPALFHYQTHRAGNRSWIEFELRYCEGTRWNNSS
jgi:phosphoglycerate-specific signal transduction histidine kinase